MPKIHERKEKRRRSAKTEAIINYQKKVNPVLAQREIQSKKYEKTKNAILKICGLVNSKNGIVSSLSKLGESLTPIEKTPKMDKTLERLYKRCTKLSRLCEVASRTFEEPRKTLDEMKSTFEKDSEICSMVGALCGAVALETHHEIYKDKIPISLNYPYKATVKPTIKNTTRTRTKRKAFIKPVRSTYQSS
jgi:hypothetical protein